MTDAAYLTYLAAERAASKAGLVPFLGEWHQSFDIRPISYSAGGAARRAFTESVHAQLSNRFLFSNLIEVTINLQLDPQTVMESGAYGDVDNYSKSINDAMKGRDGVFIDDCQIYRLSAGFELTGHTAFDIRIKATLPEEYVLKDGLKLYGMPDGLYYPQATAVWEECKVDHLDTFNTFGDLLILETMTRNKTAMRHRLRSAGLSKLRAFQTARPTTPLQLGLHRSRAVASELEIVEHEDWRAAYTEFARADGDRIAEIEREMSEYVRVINQTGDHLGKLLGRQAPKS
jgi:Holliday junction resolvase RusA-like endonuclease